MSADNGAVGGGGRGITTDGHAGRSHDDHKRLRQAVAPDKGTNPSWNRIAQRTFWEFSADPCADCGIRTP